MYSEKATHNRRGFRDRLDRCSTHSVSEFALGSEERFLYRTRAENAKRASRIFAHSALISANRANPYADSTANETNFLSLKRTSAMALLLEEVL